MKVSRILAVKGKEVITIRPQQTIREAIARLAERNIGDLVVVDDAGQPVGIISERDIIHQAARREDLFTQPVEEIMTTQLVTIVPQDDLRSVANTMLEKRIRHLPVLDGETLVGIISIGDLVKAQRDEYEGELDRLQARMLHDDES